MLREITDIAEAKTFLDGILPDPACGSPLLLARADRFDCKLARPAASDRDLVLGVWEDGALAGVFSFLVLREEKYLECLAALSRSRAAYDEAFGEVRARFPGYLLDCVCPAANRLYQDACAALGGRFETTQLALRMGEPRTPAVAREAVRYAPEHELGYRAIHEDEDVYWTAERVLHDDGFDVYLALDGGTVVGYADVRRFPEEDEIYNIVVVPERRGQGFGRALMARLLADGDARKMYLQVDEDNAASLALCRSFGFREQPGESSVTVHVGL